MWRHSPRKSEGLSSVASAHMVSLQVVPCGRGGGTPMRLPDLYVHGDVSICRWITSIYSIFPKGFWWLLVSDLGVSTTLPRFKRTSLVFHKIDRTPTALKWGLCDPQGLSTVAGPGEVLIAPSSFSLLLSAPPLALFSYVTSLLHCSLLSSSFPQN